MPCPDVPPPPPPPRPAVVDAVVSVDLGPLLSAGVLVESDPDESTAAAGVVSEPVTGAAVARLVG